MHCYTLPFSDRPDALDRGHTPPNRVAPEPTVITQIVATKMRSTSIAGTLPALPKWVGKSGRRQLTQAPIRKGMDLAPPRPHSSGECSRRRRHPELMSKTSRYAATSAWPVGVRIRLDKRVSTTFKPVGLHAALCCQDSAAEWFTHWWQRPLRKGMRSWVTPVGCCFRRTPKAPS